MMPDFDRIQGSGDDQLLSSVVKVLESRWLDLDTGWQAVIISLVILTIVYALSPVG